MLLHNCDVFGVSEGASQFIKQLRSKELTAEQALLHFWMVKAAAEQPRATHGRAAGAAAAGAMSSGRTRSKSRAARAPPGLPAPTPAHAPPAAGSLRSGKRRANVAVEQDAGGGSEAVPVEESRAAPVKRRKPGKPRGQAGSKGKG